MKTNTTVSLAIAVGLLVAGPAAVTQASFGPITFGTTINHPGHYVLTGDLSAGAAAGPAITILASDVDLDLHGHSITGNGTVTDGSNLGIWVAGTATAPLSNVHIHGGSVSQFHFGVWLDYTTDSRVTEMNLVGNHGGIGLNESSGNSLTKNTATSAQSSGYGIYLQGTSDNNQISENACTANNWAGIAVISGSGNTIEKNVANDNLPIGIWLRQGTDNVVRENQCNNNGTQNSFGFGIVLGLPKAFGGPIYVTGTVVEQNVAMGQNQAGLHWDVYDTSIEKSACDNTWGKNVFAKDNETGAAFGPGAGCIQ